VADILDDRGLKKGTIGIEETVRHFIVDGIQRSAPGFHVMNGSAITRGCHMYKSAAEIALMQVANDGMLAAYRLHRAVSFNRSVLRLN
jgi:Xaa-Pro dipeptidase